MKCLWECQRAQILAEDGHVQLRRGAGADGDGARTDRRGVCGARGQHRRVAAEVSELAAGESAGDRPGAARDGVLRRDCAGDEGGGVLHERESADATAEQRRAHHAAADPQPRPCTPRFS